MQVNIFGKRLRFETGFEPGKTEPIEENDIFVEPTGISFGHWYYLFWWNWLRPDMRYIGPNHLWYDGPHYSFGLWFTNITWTFPWSNTSDKVLDKMPWIKARKKDVNS